MFVTRLIIRNKLELLRSWLIVIRFSLGARRKSDEILKLLERVKIVLKEAHLRALKVLCELLMWQPVFQNAT